MFTTSISSQPPLFLSNTLVSSILVSNIFMSNIFLSDSWASFCLHLFPSNYQSLFQPDLLDGRKIFKVLVSANVNHVHNYLLIFSIESCKNFSDNLQNTTNARIPNNREPLPRNRKASKLSFKFLQNSKQRLKVIKILMEACTQVNL